MISPQRTQIDVDTGPGVTVKIAGHTCHVLGDGAWWHATDLSGGPDGSHLSGAFPVKTYTYEQVKDLMAELFGVVDGDE